MMNLFSTPNDMAETLLANQPVGILVYEGETGNCVLASQAAADMFGGSVETLRQQNFQALASRCQLAEAAPHDSLSGHHEVTLQTASSKMITLDCFISRFDFEGKPHLLCTVSDITETKRTHAALERERALLRCVIDSARDLIFIKDQESVYRACNKASEAFIGIPESDQVGKTDYYFFDAKMAEWIQKDDRQVLDKGKPLHTENWVTDKDGRRLLMDTVKSPYYDPDGKPLGLVGISRDLTERKLLEQEHLNHLRFLENMDRVNRAIQVTSDLAQMMQDVLDAVLAVFNCDRAFLIYPCDPEASAWKVLMERTKAEYPGTAALGRKMPMTPHVAEIFRVLLASDAPVTFGPGTEYPLPADVSQQFGIKCFVSMALHPRKGPAWQFGLHQFGDARAWTKAEERLFQEIGRRLTDGLSTLLAQRDLRRSMAKLEEAQHLAHIGNWELDLTHNVLIWSDEIFRIFEIDPETFGASYEAFLDAVHPGDREAVNQAFANSIEDRTLYAIEHRLLFPDGRIKYVHERGQTFYEADKPVRSIGTVQDITERKTIEEMLRKLNTELDQRVLERTAQLETVNKEMHAFTYTVSHDLRAPLRHIDGFLELLQKKAAAVLDQQSRHYLEAISQAANKMGLLIDDLLSFSRMGRHAISFQQVELAPLVREVIAELEPDVADRTIEWCVNDLPVVSADRSMLRMVLVYLMANAVKFTRLRQAARIEIGSQPGQASEAVIFVRDNGVGFDMAYADKLFGVFQRLHRADEFEGTGIGLAIVRRIIARHGGRTWAQGEPDQGAVFFFSLPQTTTEGHL
jgi:PAS domain S-box-containing protein